MPGFGNKYAVEAVAESEQALTRMTNFVIYFYICAIYSTRSQWSLAFFVRSLYVMKYIIYYTVSSKKMNIVV